MVWRIEISDTAKRNLAKIGKAEAQRIVTFLRERVPNDNPRQTGKALQGARLGELWRYRVGDYRIICELQDSRLVVLVVKIGHRKEIYR